MDLSLRLTKKQQQAIADGERLTISLLPPRTRRKLPPKNDQTDDVHVLINTWNEHDFILGAAVSERRNNPIKPEDINSLYPFFAKALTNLGLAVILAEIRSYLAACQEGRHLWDGRNHGYAHLGGLIRKLIAINAGKGTAWWKNGKPPATVDPHPELTEQVANAFSKAYLGRERYGLTAGSTVYCHFQEAATRLARASTAGSPISQEHLLSELIKAAGRWVDDDGVAHPKTLASEYTWSVVLPQRLKRISS